LFVTNILVDGALEIADAQSTNSTRRFYRAAWFP